MQMTQPTSSNPNRRPDRSSTLRGGCWIIIILAAITILVTVRIKSFPVIESVRISPYKPEGANTHVLSVDGQTLIMGDLSTVDLTTGASRRTFDSFVTPEWRKKYTVEYMYLDGRDGRMVLTTHDSEDNHPIFLLYPRMKTISKPLYLGSITQASPFGSRLPLTPPCADIIPYKVYDYTTGDTLIVPIDPVANDTDHIRGAGAYLWNQEANLPIRYLFVLKDANYPAPTSVQNIIVFDNYRALLREKYPPFHILYTAYAPDYLSAIRYSPDGNFILIARWICDPSSKVSCEPDLEGKTVPPVMDTALILLDWRSGEAHELIRLSQVSPANVVGERTEWSPDGSTILVWRKNNDSPVVIKMKNSR
jgi:hypothetical protein